MDQEVGTTVGQQQEVPDGRVQLGCGLVGRGVLIDSTELQSYGKPNSDLGFLLANGPGWGPLAILGYLTALSYLIQIYCYSGANWDPRVVVARPGIA